MSADGMMKQLLEILHARIAGISVETALVFAAIAVTTFVFLSLLRGILMRFVPKKRGQRGGVRALIAGLMHDTNWLFLLVVALWAGSFAVALNRRAEAAVTMVIEVALIIQIGAWAMRLVLFGIERMVRGQIEDGDDRLATATSALTFFARVVVWSLVLMLILGTLKINVTALVTGLGIGGIAVALAAQNILGDLFASLSILLDKPFAVGHFIVVGDYMGTVEKVGIKSTRIRSLSGEEIVVSNTSLLSARIHNYRQMRERRILFVFGVTYDTAPDRLRALPEMVKKIVESVAKTRFDRAHFKSFGDSSLDFEVVYYVLDPDYNLYMDIQHEINLKLFETCAEHGIDFAFPTRTVHMIQAPAG